MPEGHGGRVFGGSEHGAGVTVVVIAAAPETAQELHAHPVEEVVAVQQGAARFDLGEQQERIVRGGEIVRVPAGVAHRWVAGAAGLQAVAVYGAPEVVTEPVTGAMTPGSAAPR